MGHKLNYGNFMTLTASSPSVASFISPIYGRMQIVITCLGQVEAARDELFISPAIIQFYLPGSNYYPSCCFFPLKVIAPRGYYRVGGWVK